MCPLTSYSRGLTYRLPRRRTNILLGYINGARSRERFNPPVPIYQIDKFLISVFSLGIVKEVQCLPWLRE